MGRSIAFALLGIGALSLSCSRNYLPAQQAASGSAAIVAAASDSTDPADYAQLGGLESKFESLAKTLAPSVVSISASSQAFDSDDLLRAEDMNPEKLDSLLDRTTRMVGTGLIVDADGYILTNEHVVGEAENVWVTTDGGRVYPALVVGTDPRADLAVLKIPAGNLTPVKFTTDRLRRGQWAIALGNPYGLATAGGECISIGVVSALDRSLPKLSKKENRLYSGLVQTTTQINPGNSGGPLFDIKGRVIGINTAVILPEKKTNGIGFAIPVTEQLLASVEDLKRGRPVVYGYLGVSVSTPTMRERREAGVDPEEGVRVETVDKGSPAAGVLKENDFVVRVNAQPVRDSDQFVRLVGTSQTDHPADIIIYRDGRARTISVPLGKRQAPLTAVTRMSRRIRWEGIVLGPVPRNWEASRKGGDADRGLVVLAVAEKSRFAKQGVHEGDIIVEIAGKALADVTDLQQVLNDLPPSQRDIGQIKMVSRKSAVASSSPLQD
jgi:serine protease Do